MDECKNKVNIHLKRAESPTIMSPRSRMALFDKNVQSTPKSCGSNEISKVGKCKEKVNRAKSPIIKSTRSRTEGFDKNVECTVNAFNANEISKMEKCRGQVHIQLDRAKSPIIMTPRSRMALHDKKVLSTPNLLGSHEIPKKIEETKLQQDKTTIICPSKSLKHLNVCCNLQSTPNTRSFNKSVADSRIIMNLSPIKSTLNIKSNLNNDEDMYLYEKNSVSLDKLNNLNSSNFNIDNGFDNKLKTNENIKRLCNESNVHNSLYLSVNPREKHEDNVNEKTKRCLFEKENVNNISNVDTDQESLNISLDILEQVCQMSEMMDDSMSEEIHISANFERKKNKLSYFLYGDSSTKLEDTEKENELLQLALNMEDNLLTEIKSKNKLPYEGKFTSLNQLTNQISDLSKNDSKQYKNEKLKININDLLGNNLDTIDILEIGNTQMCEIANITEPLESFDDQWTQQYTCNESNLYNVKKKICLNNSLKSKGNVSNMVFKSSVDNINYRIDVKKGDLIDDITNDNSKNVRSVLKNETNFPTITKDKTFMNTSTCNGFSTAEGKSIKVSDKALHKVQSMFKDEINESSTVTKEKTFTNSDTCISFSTAGGKSIKVSDKALHKVQSMFKDEINENSTVTKDKTFTNTSICNTFSTAGGKSIKVSDKALHKVQSMFKEEINDPSTVTNDKTFTNTSICNSFSIAGGKSIKVSDIAFYKVQSMFDDDINESSTVNKDETFKNSNTYSGFPTDGCKYIKESHNALHKFQPMVKNERSGLQLNDNLLETMAIFNNCNNYSEQLNCSNTKSTSTCFEVLRNKEECALGNKSLFDTIEKFEKDQSVHMPILKNKRPGSPVYEFNHEIKKTIHDGWWENNVLQISFDEYLAKKLNGPKISLPEVVNWSLPKICNIKQFPENNIHNELIKLNIDNALNFKLHWEKDYKLPDFNRNKIYNFQDIKKLFSSHYFVDDKLIPKKWIENHFCLIVWKLAATEIKFPDHFGNKLLTVKNVTHQLLYRYYREIDKCQRSALKKILEKDESATKRIILCVSKVIKTNIADSYNIELTDGWYSVQGLVDFEMNMLLHKGIVKVGSKLMIHNAQLIGAGEGIDPLEIHDGIKLKISTNSTRRVRWYTKLGFYKNSTQPIPISLESVLPRGGIIGSLSLVILRKYPMMYLERKSNSKSILRNEKMEAIEAEKYKAYQQKSLEIISSKIESELIAEMDASTKKSKSYCLSIKKENLEVLSIDELSNIVENSSDPLEIQSLLSQDTLDALKNFKKSENERFYNEFQNRVNRVFNSQFKDARKVTSLFKLRVVDEKYATTGFKSAMLTVWNPSEEVTTALNKACEGQCYTIHHLTANGLINGDLQISSNKDTRFDFQGFKNEYSKREVASFKNILSGNSMPLFGELDFVGIVISEFSKNDNNYNEIYVSDKEMHIFRVLFQCNIKEYRYDDMMYLGSIISGINLQFKGLNQMSSIPTLYNTELSLFTTNPKNDHLLSIFDDYKMFMKKSENQDFLKCCQNRLSEIHNRNLNKLTTSNEKQHVSTSKYAFHRSYGELPVTVVKTPNATQDTFSPAQKRIKMLNKYGKTPPLNIVHTKPPDKKLMSKFKTPTRL